MNNPKVIVKGVTYESATAAGKDVGTSAHNISDACNKRSKTSMGFVWEYI